MHMWVTFAVILAAIVLFATEWVALEVTALGVVIALLLLFRLFPLADAAAATTPDVLLSGFSNPALFAVLALLVIGQGLHQTGAVEEMSQRLVSVGRRQARALVWVVLFGAGAVSAFMNNTPVVVIFIPVIATLADRFGPGAGKLLMPLSFITILGGMTTLIGSSTNLLVAGVARQHAIHIGFFDLVMPGVLLALVGALYVFAAVPPMLQAEGGDQGQASIDSGRQFLAQIDLTEGHALAGMASVSGLFPALRNVTVLMIDRGGQRLLPPFEGVTLLPGDSVVVAATRNALTALLRLSPDTLAEEAGEAAPEPQAGEIVLAEAAVAPGSRLENRRFDTNNFRRDTGCSVLGVQRHRRMQRSLISEIRLQAGDVLLIVGPRPRIRAIRADRDLLVLGGTLAHLPAFASARTAISIFVATVAAAGLGLLPILHAALIGAAAMILSGCLDVRQAVRAIDRQIVMLVGSCMAMALALDATSGARFLAGALIEATGDLGPLASLSALFLLIALFTNLLSNNATALLFTPIAISMAKELGQDPLPFLHAVIFGANCSFATPIGYQTNLLVMGPGNYRFSDFVRAGIPLLIILWLVFTIVAPFWYPLEAGTP